MMSENKFFILCLLVGVAALYWMLHERNECSQKGGIFVRQHLSSVCIKAEVID
jgi:hypothetical protein